MLKLKAETGVDELAAASAKTALMTVVVTALGDRPRRSCITRPHMRKRPARPGPDTSWRRRYGTRYRRASSSSWKRYPGG